MPYRLTQTLLAPGAATVLGGRLVQWLDTARAAGWILDLGCGPVSLVAQAGCPRVVAVDLVHRRAAAVQRAGGAALVATGDQLPFADDRVDAVWCGGLLHHLSDDIARCVVDEIVRVTRAGGHALIFDSVLPEPAWRRPLAWAVRRLDRGRYVRTQAAVEALLPHRHAWVCERFTYARNGLEGVWCAYHKAGAAHAAALG